MGSPKFNAPDGTPPKCPVCGLTIRYQERHRDAGAWVHQRCPPEASTPGTLPHLLSTVDEVLGKTDREAEPYCLAILALMNTDCDVGRASELCKLEPEFIAKVLQPLVEQGIVKDGIWHYDDGVDLDDGQHCAIMVLMWTMCSQGLILRKEGPVEARGDR